MNKLGKMIKIARLNKGLTQTELATYMGYETPQFISNWERGLSGPPLESLRKICDFIGLKKQLVFKELLELYTKKLERALK